MSEVKSLKLVLTITEFKIQTCETEQWFEDSVLDRTMYSIKIQNSNKST